MTDGAKVSVAVALVSRVDELYRGIESPLLEDEFAAPFDERIDGRRISL
jgi:hypothetical protein